MLRHSGVVILMLALACGGDDGDPVTAGSDETTSEVSEVSGSTGTDSVTSTSGGSQGEDESTTVMVDPDYERECQPDDFICDDWGCERPPDVRGGECYKRCSPGEIGGVDDECDEPERPYCSQVGLSVGGDFDCNGCAHICVSASINQCQSGADACSE